MKETKFKKNDLVKIIKTNQKGRIKDPYFTSFNGVIACLVTIKGESPSTWSETKLKKIIDLENKKEIILV